MHAKSILAILTTLAACGVSVMAGPVATDSTQLVERAFDDSQAVMELVERELIDSPVDVEARSFDDEEELSARDVEELDARSEIDELDARELMEVDARDLSEVTDLESREPHRRKGRRGGRGRGKRGRGKRGRGKRGRRGGRRGGRGKRGRRGGRGKRGRRGGRRGGGAPPPPPAAEVAPEATAEQPPAEAEAAPAVEARSIFRRRNRATAPLTDKQQARVAALETGCKAIPDKKANKKCNGLVNRLRRNMSRKNALIAEISKMSTPAPATQ